MRRSPHLRWLVAAVSILTLAPALEACSTTPDPTIGHLVGVVYIRGGIIKTTPTEATLTATPTGGHTSQTYTIDTASDGSFSFDLPQGTYELKGTLTKRNPGDKASPQDVTITAGQTTRVEVYANYP